MTAGPLARLNWWRVAGLALMGASAATVVGILLWAAPALYAAVHGL